MSLNTHVRTRRAARILPAATLGVLLLASCGQGGATNASSTTSSTVATSSAPSSTAVPAARTVAAVDTVTVRSLGTRVRTALAGVHSGTATVSVSGGDVPAGSVVTVTADATTSTARVTARVSGQAYEIRVLDGAVYATGPVVQTLTGGRTWARVDLATLAQLAGGLDRSTASPTATPDPTAVAGVVAAAVSVRDLGAATVDGTAGHTYRITLPVAALAQLTSSTGLPLSAQQRTQLRQGVDALAKQGVTVLSADLTLDGKDRPLRLTTATPALAGGVSSLRVTADFSGWGAALRLVAPPAAQVTVLDAADLTALAGSIRPSVSSSAATG